MAGPSLKVVACSHQVWSDMSHSLFDPVEEVFLVGEGQMGQIVAMYIKPQLLPDRRV